MVSRYLPANKIIDWLISQTAKPLFLVGGAVRDALLQRKSRDYDFLLEGDSIALVKGLQKKFAGEAIFNPRFLTATWRIGDLIFDFATAREEIYLEPGALPLVKPTNWFNDLKRRDFTINTLLIPLEENGWGEIIDLFGGKRDLERGLLRILSASSFRDDPTRILRALRYQNRLGFSIAGETLKLLKESWPYLQKIAPRRRFKEWRLLCAEKEVSKNIQAIFYLGGWTAFFKSLSFYPDWDESKAISNWDTYLALLLSREPEKLDELAEYWGLYPRERSKIERALK